MTGAHGRLQALVAIVQALSLSALAAAVMPLFLGAPAPFGLTVAVISLSVALGLAVGLWPRGMRKVADEDRLRAAAMAGAWALIVVLLRFVVHLAQAEVMVWGVVGFTACLAAFGTARMRTEEGARSLVARSALAAVVATVAGTVFGHGPLAGTAALGLVALAVCAIAHAVARAHYRAVDPDRVSRSAFVIVAIIAALAVLFAIGPVHDAAAAALGFAWAGIAFALEVVAYGVGFIVWGMVAVARLLVHGKPGKPPHEQAGLGKTASHGAAPLHPPPTLMHLTPYLLLVLAGALAVWLVGRIRRSHAADEPLYHDEILHPRSLERSRRGRVRRRAPAEGLARAYAQALAVLAAAGDARVHPLPADTPNALADHLDAVVGAGAEAPIRFRRLSQAYADWHYGTGPNRTPDPLDEVLSFLRRVLPAGRRRRRAQP